MLTKYGKFLIVALALTLTASGCGSKDHDSDDDSGEEDGGDDAANPDPNTRRDGPVKKDVARNEVIANFKGAKSVQKVLEDRLLAESGDVFDLGRYLDGRIKYFLYGLPTLLGYQVAEGLVSEFRNGQANGINMLLWHMLITSFAEDVAGSCSPAPVSSSLALKPEALTIIKKMCKWPAKTARNKEAFRAYWNLVLQHDAPEAEYLAFETFFLGDDYAKEDGPATVKAMMTAMLYNPHFLVRK